MINFIKSNKAFTLVEIAIAVTLLGLGLTTIVSLQNSATEAVLNEKNRLQAALYGDYLLTMIKVSKSIPNIGEERLDISNELERTGFFALENNPNKLRENLANWQYVRRVSPVPFPIPELQNSLIKLEINLSWGDRDDQNINLIYFTEPTGNQNTQNSSQRGE